MKISFVIPAYNEEHYIKNCLDAIIRAIGGRDGYEIIVVDNNSTDGTCDIVRRDYAGTVQLLHESQRGANRARETGFVASKGDLVAFLDADTELAPGWIDRAERAFAKDPHLVCISGPFIYYDLPFVVRMFVFLFYIITYFVYLLARFVVRRSSMIQGGTEIVRRDALQKIGGHEVKLTFYGDDADLARRLSKVGEVRWSFRFSMRSSGRRLAKEGAFTMAARYTLNYFWITLFNKPYTTTSTAIRFDDGATAYRPVNALKEASLALLALAMFCAAIAAAGAVIYAIYAVSRLRL